MHEVLFVLWLLWPAGVAIMIPVFAAHVPGLRRLSYPMDAYKTFRGRRIFGDNKTWRGFVAGTVAGLLWFLVQMWLYEQSGFVQSFSELDYSSLSALWIGIAISAGALVGDAVGSFCKRQLDVAPGEAWFPYDQIDFIVGSLALSLLFVRLPPWCYLLAVPVWVAVHLLFGVLGYVFKFKKDLI